jgi:type I restriction enzyme S subunit
MKKYETYKDSGVKWIGEIPENWKSVKIKFITDIYTGNSLNSDLKILFESENENDLPYVSTKDVDIDNNTLNYNNGLRIPLDNSYYKVAPEGSFLLCIEGANAGKKMAYVEQDCCFVNKLACFNFPNKFLFYFAQSNSFKTQFFNSISGLIGGVSISVLKEFVSTIPSPKEQTQIAAYLDHKTDLIDAIIAQKEALIKKLKEQRQAIINDAVTKGLNKNVKLKDSGIEWLGKIPEHWVVCKIKHLVELKSGNFISANEIEPQGKYPVYGGNGLRGFTNKHTHYGSYILIGRQGALCGNINYAHNQFWATEHAVVTTFKTIMNLDYFGELLRSMNLNQYNESAAQPGLAVGKIENLNIPKISIDEQEKIASFIKLRINLTKTLICKNMKQIEKLKEYRQSLISEAVTGKIDVRDWQAPKS